MILKSSHVPEIICIYQYLQNIVILPIIWNILNKNLIVKISPPLIFIIYYTLEGVLYIILVRNFLESFWRSLKCFVEYNKFLDSSPSPSKSVIETYSEVRPFLVSINPQLGSHSLLGYGYLFSQKLSTILKLRKTSGVYVQSLQFVLNSLWMGFPGNISILNSSQVINNWLHFEYFFTYFHLQYSIQLFDEIRYLPHS